MVSGEGPAGTPRGAERDGASDHADEPAPVERSLGGALPCVTCGYNLQGLSIRGVCPECGTAVSATILAVVDPFAAELRPIARPRLVALGLLVWIVAALGAVVMMVGALGREWLAAIRSGGGRSIPTWGPGSTLMPDEWAFLGWLIAGCLWLSALGAAVLVRPHDAIPRRSQMLAALGVTLYVPLGLVVLRLGFLAGEAVRAGATLPLAPTPRHTIWRVAAFALALLILLFMRPNVRLLVARSLVMRTGRVDRQTILAMAAAIGMLILGDVASVGATLLPPGLGEFVTLFGTGLMTVGGLLLLLGLVSSTIDCLRIARAIMTPSPGLRQVLSGEDHAAAGHDHPPRRL